MKALVACEESGRVRDALIAVGIDAVSCDLLPSDRPGPHIQGDVRDLDLDEYQMLIAFPPCTDLAVSGAHRFKEKIADGRQQRALDFVRYLLDAPCEFIALENPVGVISSQIRKPDQIIQPYHHKHPESKTTCLWLKNLPPLEPTGVVDPPWYGCCGARFPFARGKYGCPICNGEKKARPVYANQTPSGQNRLGPSATRALERARTYEGIAAAMADQWGRAALRAMKGGSDG